MGDRRRLYHNGFLYRDERFLRKSVCAAVPNADWHRTLHVRASRWDPFHSRRWARIKPAPAPPGHDYPSANALSWLRLVRHSVRIRHRRTDHRPHRRPLDPPDAPLDSVGMAVPLLWTRAWRTLGVRCARLGRLLGLGSRRDRGVHALADRHRIFTFGHDPGKARHAQALEYATDHIDL